VTALQAARVRQDALHALTAGAFWNLTRRSFPPALSQLEQALEIATATEVYLGPDERALEALIAAAAVTAELAARLEHHGREQEQARAVLERAVQLRVRVFLGDL